jgi:hypothetical protein
VSDDHGNAQISAKKVCQGGPSASKKLNLGEVVMGQGCSGGGSKGKEVIDCSGQPKGGGGLSLLLVG